MRTERAVTFSPGRRVVGHGVVPHGTGAGVMRDVGFGGLVELQALHWDTAAARVLGKCAHSRLSSQP